MAAAANRFDALRTAPAVSHLPKPERPRPHAGVHSRGALGANPTVPRAPNLTAAALVHQFLCGRVHLTECASAARPGEAAAVLNQDIARRPNRSGLASSKRVLGSARITPRSDRIRLWQSQPILASTKIIDFKRTDHLIRSEDQDANSSACAGAGHSVSDGVPVSSPVRHLELNRIAPAITPANYSKSFNSCNLGPRYRPSRCVLKRGAEDSDLRMTDATPLNYHISEGCSLLPSSEHREISRERAPPTELRI